jgi:hypothetical protein
VNKNRVNRHRCSMLLDMERKLLTRVQHDDSVAIHQQDTSGYSRSGDLNQHVATQDGVKSYICELCRTIFTGTRNLKFYEVVPNGNLNRNLSSFTCVSHAVANSQRPIIWRAISDRRLVRSTGIKEFTLVRSRIPVRYAVIVSRRLMRSKCIKEFTLVRNRIRVSYAVTVSRRLVRSKCIKEFTLVRSRIPVSYAVTVSRRLVRSTGIKEFTLVRSRIPVRYAVIVSCRLMRSKCIKEFTLVRSRINVKYAERVSRRLLRLAKRTK